MDITKGSEKQIAFATSLTSQEANPARRWIAEHIAEVADAAAVIDYLKGNATLDSNPYAQQIADWVTSLNGEGFESPHTDGRLVTLSLTALVATLISKIASAAKLDALMERAEQSGKPEAFADRIARSEAAAAFLERIGF